MLVKYNSLLKGSLSPDHNAEVSRARQQHIEDGGLSCALLSALITLKLKKTLRYLGKIIKRL